MIKAVFLDRDGTINIDRGYVHTKEQFELLPKVEDALSRLQAMGYALVIITNQSGIGRGYFTEDEYLEFQEYIQSVLRDKGITLTAQYYCPHVDEDGCSCRKPATGLFELAARELDIDWENSYVIGDRLRDLCICESRPLEGFLISNDIVDTPDNVMVVGSLYEAALEIEKKNKKIVIYGLSIETKRVLDDWADNYHVIGLLDGFRTSGEMYGYPILNIEEVANMDDVMIIVVARPGSCKAIAKRIGTLCKSNDIALFDIRGKDLLEEIEIRYGFDKVDVYKRTELVAAIDSADIISFDLFDTLVMRSVYSVEDVLEVLGLQINRDKLLIKDFVMKRVQAEKELSRNCVPTLLDIYEYLIEKFNVSGILASDLAELEYELDMRFLCPRYDVIELLEYAKKSGKKVYIISDSYYTENQIQLILNNNNIPIVDGVLISCECGISKTGGLFDYYKSKCCSPLYASVFLHIGDDVVADIEAARRSDLSTFKLYNSGDLLDLIGGLGLVQDNMAISDRIKIGLFIARLFNSPFQFENDYETTGNSTIHIDSAYDVGYLLFAPLFIDFILWFHQTAAKNNLSNIWLCARDGYMIKKIWDQLFPEQHAEYLLTSRIASIRAGVSDETDILDIEGMKFSGSVADAVFARFGINCKDCNHYCIDNTANNAQKYVDCIISEAARKKINYKKYLSKIMSTQPGIALFDFVAKGTTQFYLQKNVPNKITGLYFMQLEPEYMVEKMLDIISFYSIDENKTSSIYEYYYILETILTSPDPSLLEFDADGRPVFANETRESTDIDCIMKVQDGIVEYIKKMKELIPLDFVCINKQSDENYLQLIRKLDLRVDEFLGLIVEDPFFNRYTPVKDIL